MGRITGWWFSHPSEKYESQLGWIFPIYGKIKHGNQTTNQIGRIKICAQASAIHFCKATLSLVPSAECLWRLWRRAEARARAPQGVYDAGKPVVDARISIIRCWKIIILEDQPPHVSLVKSASTKQLLWTVCDTCISNLKRFSPTSDAACGSGNDVFVFRWPHDSEVYLHHLCIYYGCICMCIYTYIYVYIYDNFVYII